jgi:hypothetical protein
VIDLSAGVVEPVPGTGMIRRRGNALVVILGDASSVSATSLLEAVGDGVDDGRIIARRIAATLVTRSSTDVSPFCLLAQSGARLVAMVHSSIVVRVDGVAVFRGDDSPTWVDGYIDAASVITILPDGGTPSDLTGRWNLEAGTVPGGGVIVAFGEAARKSIRPQDDAMSDEPPTSDQLPVPTDDEPEAEQSFELIDLDEAPTEQRVPLPTNADEQELASRVEVEGIRCSRGHFNHPDARYCASCGIKMVHLTRKPVLGPRPPVGLLVGDDGTTWALDTGYVIGREPQLDEGVRSGTARPLVMGEAGTMSRVHAEIQLDGWDVLVIDLGSTNGTFVRIGEQGWERLAPREARAITPGTEISLGERRMVFESNVVPKP